MVRDSSKDSGAGGDASVTPIRGRARVSPMKGKAPSEAQKVALKKGTEANRARGALRKKRDGGVPGKTRWRQLCDGDITVASLETVELQRMQTKDAIGAFGGTAPKNVPAHIARDMRAELLKRGQSIIDSAYVDAVEVLASVMRSKSARSNDRIRAAQLIVERSAGRMPETVRIEGTAKWDETFEDGVVETQLPEQGTA
jgi:hypothetical protein